MYLRKDGVDLVNGVPVKKLETPEDPKSKVIVREDPGITITITGKDISRISNIEVYFTTEEEKKNG